MDFTAWLSVLLNISVGQLAMVAGGGILLGFVLLAIAVMATPRGKKVKAQGQPESVNNELATLDLTTIEALIDDNLRPLSRRLDIAESTQDLRPYRELRSKVARDIGELAIALRPTYIADPVAERMLVNESMLSVVEEIDKSRVRATQKARVNRIKVAGAKDSAMTVSPQPTRRIGAAHPYQYFIKDDSTNHSYDTLKSVLTALNFPIPPHIQWRSLPAEMRHKIRKVKVGR